MRPFFCTYKKKSNLQKKIECPIPDFPGFSRVKPQKIFPARFARRDFRLRPSACPRFPGIFASDLVLVPDFPGADLRK